ncbi:MAG: RNA polymerase sigma-70 factor [Pedobacter sp.]|nr:RNA polymerase sigma-70 factor [Pedobacter sp.]
MSFKATTDSIVSGKDLLRLIDNNDKEEFTAFYSENFQKLILVSDKYVKDIFVAEEIVQDIFLKIWEDKDLLSTVNAIKSYLHRSVVNTSINYINRQKNIEQHHLKIAAHLTDEDIDLIDEQNELIALLYNEIDLLPEKCQKVFKMSRLEGLKYRDIALELSISEKTVENHMGNALRILRLRVLKNIEMGNGSNSSKYISLLSLFLY